MDPITTKWMQRSQATETLAEYEVRTGEDRGRLAAPPPRERATVLLRMWMRPETAVWVRPRHIVAVSGEVARAQPRAWRTMWWSLALLMLAFVAGDAAPTGQDHLTAIAVVLVLTLTMSAGFASSLRVVRALSDPEVHKTTLAHTAWEAVEPLEHEDAPEWDQLVARVTEYVELREHVTWAVPLAFFRHSPVPAEALLVEDLRLHLRSAAVALRQYHAAWDARTLAVDGGDAVLASVPRLQAEHTHTDFEEHLHHADAALEAIRPIALAAKVNAQLRPLSIPMPEPQRARPEVGRRQRSIT